MNHARRLRKIRGTTYEGPRTVPEKINFLKIWVAASIFLDLFSASLAENKSKKMEAARACGRASSGEPRGVAALHFLHFFSAAAAEKKCKKCKAARACGGASSGVRRAPFFGVNIDYFSKYLRKIFQKIGPAGGWGRSRPFFGVNIDYFLKYLRKTKRK